MLKFTVMQVHIILGLGNLPDNCESDQPTPTEGAMADIRASPNDPVFINHHAMIDLIFEMWLQDHPGASYEGPPTNSKFPGHAAGDCAVPFIPVYTHSQIFKLAGNFGYSYTELEAIDSTAPAITTAADSNASPNSIMGSLSLVITGIMLTLMTVLCGST